MTDPMRRPSVEEIEDAIDRLVTVLVFHRLGELPRRPDSRAQMREAEQPFAEWMTAAQLMETPPSILRERDLVQDPIGQSLKRSIRKLAQAAFDQMGEMQGLEALCDRISALDPEQHDYRSMLLDKAFDGVGAGNIRWVA